MQKVLILANCQGPALAKILEKVVDGQGNCLFDVLNLKPVYELTHEQQPLLEDLCRQCDILLYQPHIRYKFTPEWRSSDYWVSITSAKHIISFPSLYFAGYNPELTYLRNKQNQHLNAGFVDYHDKRIVKLLLEGRSDEDIKHSFHRLQPVREDVESVLKDTLAELRRREQEQQLDISVSKFVEQNFTRERLFYTYNHPANSVLYEVIRQLLEKVGCGEIAVPKVEKELLRYDYFPIAPAVSKYLGLKFADDGELYRVQNKDLRRAQVVDRYLEIYRDNRGWVDEAATFVGEAWLNRRKLILHIGQSKTGTTSFQSFCFKHRKALLAEGTLYPEAGLLYTHHRSLALHYKGEQRDEALVQQLKQEIAAVDCERVLISCESFEDLGVSQAQELLNDFSDMDVSIVCTLRNRLEWVQSMYAEYVKKAWFSGSFSQFIGYRKVHSRLDRVLNWKLGLSRRENQIIRHVHKLLSDRSSLSFWFDLLPKEKLIFASAEKFRLWELLFRECGISKPDVEEGEEKRLNPSPSVQAVEFARLHFRRQKVQDLHYPIAMHFSLRLDKDFDPKNSPGSFFCSNEQIAGFLSRYMADDIWLQQNFGFSRSDVSELSEKSLAESGQIPRNFDERAEAVAATYQSVLSKFS
ncbi:WcbI family polysaccharide biosynthesis putative acetyltransferase [Microbulbifer sp. CAU 1566]|uniref:WcbI family polysaccharide biosynthesis putative acetyltransferase n=1 Tax=Microbulbifer sp. CAU 1566 TaxID=2933269 RepID=UPI00200323D7|nr:WcbI family polysaccharide biosynthesis putative acetyltransferase [Microbulbifer sp. CAU 1566]MCK7597354.1 WcbI family polysaccharide biosynthesis putative acetyltransferase [Microbulbifer sp. CAU 1566]